jgi:hypothetical protein
MDAYIALSLFSVCKSATLGRNVNFIVGAGGIAWRAPGRAIASIVNGDIENCNKRLSRRNGRA